MIPLAMAVNRQIVLLSSEAKANGVFLQNEVPDGLSVSVDLFRLETIMYNLISNAIKFTPKNGTIKILVEPNGDTVHITVKDSGVGIRAEDLGELFTKPTSVSAGDFNTRKSTGLGLLQVKRCAEEIPGGSITVRSEVGVGTEFTFTVLAGSARKD